MSQLYDVLMVMLLAMMPISELRGAIPYGILVAKLDPLLVFVISIIFNFLPVPFLLIFLHKIEEIAMRWKPTKKFIEKYFGRVRRRASKKVEIYEEIALILFVAVPLPITGAWTGSVIAYLFDLDFKKSLLTIFLGILIAGVIVITITLFFS